MDDDRLFEVMTFPWDSSTTHSQHALSLVIKWKILRPSDHAWGYFYDPQSNTAREYRPPAEVERIQIQKYSRGGIVDQGSLHHTSLAAGGPLPMSRPVAGVIRMPAKVEHVEIEAENGGVSIQDNLAGASLPVSLQRRYPIDGLHYVRMGLSGGDIRKNDCPKLLLDTACPITWMYHPDVKQLDVEIRREYDDELGEETITSVVTRTNIPLERYKLAKYYTEDLAERLDCARELRIPFGDMFTADFRFYRAPLWLVRRFNMATNKYQVAHVPDMVFGQAIYATLEGSSAKSLRRCDQMDGIFGAALGCSADYAINPIDGKPDIFIQKYCISKGYPVASFAVTLGNDDEQGSSWMVIGPTDNIINNLHWTPWMNSGSKVYWTIALTGMTVGYHSRPVDIRLASPVRMIIDTASSCAIVPEAISEGLLAAMGSTEQTEFNPDVLKARQIPVTFHFESFSTTVPSLEYFLDSRAGEFEDDELLPCAFQPGVILRITRVGLA